jgi:hypothetical protein
MTLVAGIRRGSCEVLAPVRWGGMREATYGEASSAKG